MTNVYRPDTHGDGRALIREDREDLVAPEAFHQRLARIEARQRAARRSDDAERGGDGLRFLVELVAVIALAFGIFYGQPYVECRRMKDRGDFWYGDTIKSCMNQRIAQRNEAIEAAGARVVALLPGGR